MYVYVRVYVPVYVCLPEWLFFFMSVCEGFSVGYRPFQSVTRTNQYSARLNTNQTCRLFT